MYIYTAPICKLNALRVHRVEEEGRLEGETEDRKQERSSDPGAQCVWIRFRGITTKSNTVSAHHVYPSLEKVRLLLQLIHDSSFQVLASITTYS